MRADPQVLDELAPMIVEGDLDEVRRRMLAIWPGEAYWDADDVNLVTMLLRGAHRARGAAARPVYEAFAERLRGAGDGRGWLQTLDLRAEIVAAYEGHDRAAEWLAELALATPPPANGVVDLVRGRLLMARGQWAEARRFLSQAVNMSLHGVEWYRLEALGEMGLCLVRLGESRLAFEYARAHSLEKYKLGRLEEGDLYEAVYGNALLFGQIDYVIDVKRNLARRSRERGDHTWAAIHESDAGFRLAQFGLRGEAVPVLLQAAADAGRGRHPGDPAFSLTCALLARYLAPDRLRPEGLAADLRAASAAPGPLPSAALRAAEEAVTAGAALDPAAVGQWQEVCGAYTSGAMRSNAEARQGLVLVHLAALLGRYHAEGGHSAAAEALYDALTPAGPVRDAVFLFAREDRVERLLAAGRFQGAMDLCRPALAKEDLVAHERFGHRQMAARASAGLGDDPEAYRYARLALGDWKRVLEGLYDERRKVAWLERGAACLACAVRVLRRPVAWMPEPERRRELFRLTELGRARLATDMVSHAGHVPGAYLVPDSTSRRLNVLEALIRESPDWFAPVMLQLSSFADVMSTVVHGDDGRVRGVIPRDVTALRGVIQLPLSPEKRYYATADALTFEGAPVAGEGELSEDLMRALAPPDDS